MEIDKYIKKVSIMDYYITHNICDIILNKKEVEFLKKNIYILALNNKQGNNSLNILINNKKFDFIKDIIKHNKCVLKICNSHEYNLFQSLIFYEVMYDTINEILLDENISFLTHIILKKNSQNTNFIDLCIEMLNITNKTKNIIDIVKKIYNIQPEEVFFVITKLCKSIKDDKKLQLILSNININNIDIYSDEYYNTCIDYLIERRMFQSLSYLINKVNFIFFENYDNNSLYNLIDNYPDMISIIFKIMNKCDFNLIKNKKNENLLYKLIKTYDIDENTINKYVNKFDIFEQNVYGDNLYNLLLRKYKKNITKILTNEYHIDSQVKFENPHNININIENTDFNIKNLLSKSTEGIFNSNTLHYIIYLIIFLKKYDFDVPNFYDKSEQYLLEQSNNDENLIKLFIQYYEMFNSIFPHIMIWKNIDNYFIHSKLVELIEKSKKRFVYVKLTLIITIPNGGFIRHANIILIDKNNKIIERFEPYGNLSNTFNKELNNTIEKEISDKLGYTFVYCNPYAGFQTLSDESNEFNRTINDPTGYCLAWCMLYLELKLKYGYDCLKTISLIKNYIINKFTHDFDIKDKSNIYMIFIRYYAKYLDNEKNKLLKKCDINKDIIYYENLKNNDLKKIVKCLNKKINKITDTKNI